MDSVAKSIPLMTSCAERVYFGKKIYMHFVFLYFYLAETIVPLVDRKDCK